jgi:polysulfide reductase chain C
MKAHVWTWPIAGYLFLGGLGAGMTVVCAVADLFFGAGALLWPSAVGAVLALGLGSGLLIFELGRPFQFWRVFSRQMAVLTWGAWMVALLVVIDVLYLSCWLDFLPWSGIAVLRLCLATVGLLLAGGVLLYTGIELSSMKARVFWNTPALPLLFVLAGLLNGCAADLLVVMALPGQSLAALLLSGVVFMVMRTVTVVLVVLTLIGTLLYVLMMYTSSNVGAREVARRWLRGSYAPAFWGGLMAAGLFVPLVLFAIDGTVATAGAAVLVVIGGVFLRFLIVYSDDRRQLDAEAAYWSHLPEGDELFLKRDWG